MAAPSETNAPTTAEILPGELAGRLDATDALQSASRKLVLIGQMLLVRVRGPAGRLASQCSNLAPLLLKGNPR